MLWSVDKHLFIFRELSPQSEIHETNENEQPYASAGLFESSNKKVESKTVQIFLSTFQQCGDTVWPSQLQLHAEPLSDNHTQLT